MCDCFPAPDSLIGKSAQGRHPSPRFTRMLSFLHARRYPIARISISDGTGIGFGQRLTQATASAIEGSSQIQ